MTVGLLGLQGAFLDHIPHLKRCGASYHVIRSRNDLDIIDRLIIPGGESTVMTKFLDEFDMRQPLIQRLCSGMPAWGICAGCILLAKWIDGKKGRIGVLDVSVTRNAYGRQIASKEEAVDVPIFGIKGFSAVFIRAPKIESLGKSVIIHALAGSDPVFIQSGQIMATTFHPELTSDSVFHDFFLKLPC